MIDDKTYNAVLRAAKDGTLVDAVPYGCAAEIDVGGETKSAPLLDVIDRLIAENERLREALRLVVSEMEAIRRYNAVFPATPRDFQRQQRDERIAAALDKALAVLNTTKKEKP